MEAYDPVSIRVRSANGADRCLFVFKEGERDRERAQSGELLPKSRKGHNRRGPPYPNSEYKGGTALWGYMEAIQDLSVLAEDDGRRLLGSCPPEQITLLQLIRSFVSYAHSHPGQYRSRGDQSVASNLPVSSVNRPLKDSPFNSSAASMKSAGCRAAAPPRDAMNSRRSFDHLVRAGEERRRYFEAERLRRDEVDREIELARRTCITVRPSTGTSESEFPVHTRPSQKCQLERTCHAR
jgi:hypothetical protein